MKITLLQKSRKGKLKYTYSPFENYRASLDLSNDLSEDEYKEKGKIYKLFEVDSDKSIIVNGKKKIVTKEQNETEDKKGTIKELTTSRLNFNPNYPVDIEIQESYDKSVNLILNDNYNKPRIVNSRFSSRSLDTYEIADREGVNDTNLYDSDTFDIDTSLYKIWNNLSKISYLGFVSGGNLKVGNYVFYFKYADADGNETDFIGESGIIPVFIGNDSDPFSINGGFKNMNSNKGVLLLITNIDLAYDYLVVYYTRSYADVLENRVTSAYKVNKKFTLHTQSTTVSIFGTEDISEVPLTDLNTLYFIASKAQTLAQCSNRLFLGGVSKPEINYKEFTDISLRILPVPEALDKNNLIGNVSVNDYTDDTGKYEYYNSVNVYKYVGYWPEEIYRFGVVYILEDNTHTQVFNVRGIQQPTELNSYTSFPFWKNEEDRNYILVDEETKLILNSNNQNLENSKGVIQIPLYAQDKIVTINFFIDEESRKYLKNYLKVKGIIFVRQKRVPTILAQGLVLPMESFAHVPLINYNNEYYFESFFDNSGILTHDYSSRLRKLSIGYKLNVLKNKQSAIICPEFELNLPYYNLFFTGSKYMIKPITQPKTLKVNVKNDRIYTYEDLSLTNNQSCTEVKIISVTENVPTVAIEDKIFLLRCGEAEDVSKFEFVDNDDVKENWDGSFLNLNLIRGIFGPYLGMVSDTNYYGLILNIYIPGYSINKMLNYFELRYQDESTYYAISDIESIDSEVKKNNMYVYTCYRGDSYLCTYTHRLNRNFNDPSSPSNDKIVDEDTWEENLKDFKTAEDFYKMNRGDINAVQLGSWITFKLRSSTNLSIRSVDNSFVSEAAVMGTPRSFYPYSQLLAKGNNKMPESSVTNDGFRSTVGERWYYQLQETPYYKNTFENRVLYSEIAITDAFKNGYRVFYSTNFQDYKKEYGKIIKLVELQGNLLCVFEKAVGILTVNERTALSDLNGGEVFINTRNVLPLEPRILSGFIGSLWKESIVKTPYFVYGVDTRAKKIWRTNGSQLEIISDLKVNKFLVEHINLKENETILIGVKNVKTHYNANKQDVMFTFYNLNNCWNLCYNEILLTFVTFYSWIPSYSENIQNLFWSFDRETSRDLVNLGCANKDTQITKGIVPEKDADGGLKPSKFVDVFGDEYPIISAEIQEDSLGNYNKVYELDGYYKIKDSLIDTPSVIYISFKITTNRNGKSVNEGIYLMPIQVRNDLTHEFWLHGRAGIYNILEEIKPTKWYGKRHPFEFEFVVNEEVFTQKVFTNLLILSNKAEPESFHFEIVGENYEWSKDKKTIYYRQEALKELASRFGYNVVFDSKYTEVIPEWNPIDNNDLLDKYYNYVYGKSYNSDFHKSILFPLYYFRNDLIDLIYHTYNQLDYPNQLGYYTGLTGTEIILDRDKSEYRVLTHVLNLPIQKYGIRKGNSSYTEDEWRVLIPSIYFKQKDEPKWDEVPPIVITDFPKTFDESIKECTKEFTYNVLPIKYLEIYDSNDCTTFSKVIDNTEWSNIKETKIRDKYIKIRVRYSGEELAIITGLITLYNESYA